MRVKAGTVTRRRHKKWLKMAEGYWGLKSTVFRRAKEAVIRALNLCLPRQETAEARFQALVDCPHQRCRPPARAQV
jgi:large subunit ribosomal protein L20